MIDEEGNLDFDLSSVLLMERSISVTSNSSKKASPHRTANARMLEKTLLIWLDNNINAETDPDCRHTIEQLQSIIYSIQIFTDSEKCVQFIEKMKSEKTCLIISGALGQTIVSQVHDMTHIESIFIFCSNKSLHETWSKDWLKIKGVYTEIVPICEILKETVKRCEENSISLNFVPTKENKINPSFVSTHILKNILLNTQFNDKCIKEFSDYCRTVLINNTNGLKSVDIFERKYHETTPIWWHSHASFLYTMLNRGLRLMDINILTKMSFFMRELQEQIEELHRKQLEEVEDENTFTVYHGQGISRSVFEQMTKNKNGLITFNNFLCASKDRRISFDFVRNALTNSNLVGIFFIMTIDPSKTTTPFAFTNDINQFEGKEEVIFPLHTVFRIREIQSMGENNRLFQVDLTLTNDSDEDIGLINNRIKEETFSDLKGWNRLGQWLITTNQFDKAEEIYQFILKETVDEEEKEKISRELNKIKDYQIQAKKKSPSAEKSNELVLKSSYESVSIVVQPPDDYSNGFPSDEQITKIKREASPLSSPLIGTLRKNFGSFRKKLVFK